MGHGVPSAARIGHMSAAIFSWQLGGSTLAAGRCAAQQSRGTSAESDAAWTINQAATQRRRRRRNKAMDVLQISTSRAGHVVRGFSLVCGTRL